MRKKIKDYRQTIFFSFYAAFILSCGCLSWLFSEYRVLLFQFWYQVTTVIWLALAVTAVVHLTKLLKLKKLRNEIKHWKE